jgi:hypothetical protein
MLTRCASFFFGQAPGLRAYRWCLLPFTGLSRLSVLFMAPSKRQVEEPIQEK